MCRHKQARMRAHTPVKAASPPHPHPHPFQEGGRGAEGAWHDRSNLLSTVARSPVLVICLLGRRSAPGWLPGRAGAQPDLCGGGVGQKEKAPLPSLST